MNLSRKLYRSSIGKRHWIVEGKRPLCGGGNGAKQAHWQTDFGDDVNCQRCLAILQRAKEAAKA